MSVDYAFAEGASGDREDQSLVQRARAGDRDALEALIKRHQGWIYNIAVRMLFHPQDAEGANWGNGVILTGKQQYPTFNVVEVFQQIRRVSFPVEKP
jgi:hypothetical protein